MPTTAIITPVEVEQEQAVEEAAAAEEVKIQNISPRVHHSPAFIKDRCMKNIVITDSNNQPTQYKKLKDILPTYCVEQKYAMLGDIIRKEEDIHEEDFYTAAPNPNQWSTTINDNVGTDAAGNPIMIERVIVVDKD